MPDLSHASRADSGMPCCRALALNVALLSQTDDIWTSLVSRAGPDRAATGCSKHSERLACVTKSNYVMSAPVSRKAESVPQGFAVWPGRS